MSGNGDKRSGLFWKLQGLLKKRGAESVRDRVEELLDGGRPNGEAPLLTDEAVTGLDLHERVLLHNVLRLRDKTAYDVMVPRADILAMPEDLTLDEAMRHIRRKATAATPCTARTSTISRAWCTSRMSSPQWVGTIPRPSR